MILYIRYYHFYRTALLRSIRLLVFALLLTVILYQIFHNESPKFAVFFFNVVVMLEVFFHYKISRAVPNIVVSKNKKETMYDSVLSCSQQQRELLNS
jgi:hypothetical protein